GAAAVAKTLPFKLSAPTELAGVKQTDVHLIGAHGSKAAAIVYGKPLLGGLVVIESKPDKRKASANEHGAAGNLPHVKVGGADATELSTALGTAISFERGGIHYTVIGPVA